MGKKTFNKPIEKTNVSQEYENPKRWYEEIADDPSVFEKAPVEKMIELKNEAKTCNDAEAAAYNIRAAKANSEYKWMKTVLSKGTMSDKVAANTILIQDNPVSNLSTLHQLVNMVKIGKKNECLSVMDTLGELFLNDLLRTDAKLKPFHSRPLLNLDKLASGNSVTRRKYLSYWYFEDQLKECYTTFVQALNKVAQESIETSKQRAINTMYKLLVGNPEQEANLLKYIVNKLGDPSQKVASKSLYCLTQLLKQHPNMNQVTLNEIEKLLFRPNVPTKAQYYAICYLTQFQLSMEDSEVAKNLVTLYFAFFKACVKKGEVNSRMMSAILMGVNRAFPYAKAKLSDISEHINTMYKIVHMANFNVSLHALALIFQVSKMSDFVNDRFYCALYKKLLDTEIGTTAHQAMFLNLVYRALKQDTRISRVKVFIKRLLQVALYMNPAMACAILYLVYSILYKRKHLLALQFHSSDVMDDGDGTEHYEDVKDNEDTEKNKENTEIEKTGENEKNTKDKNSKEVEEKENIEAKQSSEMSTKSDNTNDVEPKINGSWFHSEKTIKSEYNHPPVTCYNAIHRNPLYAGGEFCAHSELLQLKNHFHPTVALFASKLINGDRIDYSGDPLKDFSMLRFLERFSFKNPKKLEDLEKPGINPILGKRLMYIPKGLRSVAVNSDTYLKEDMSKIPVEELFLYTYLQKKRKEKPKKDDDDDESDVSSVTSEDFDQILGQLSGQKEDEEVDLDYMEDISKSLEEKKKRNKKRKDDAEESESDEEEETEEQDVSFTQDNESDNDFDGQLGDDDDDADLEDIDFGHDDMEDDGDDAAYDSDLEDKETVIVKKKARKLDKTKLKKSVFASADDFAALLDEEDDFMSGTSHAMSNKDKADKKQLAWEFNRNRWINDTEKGRKRFNTANTFSKKRKDNKQKGSKNKKFRK